LNDMSITAAEDATFTTTSTTTSLPSTFHSPFSSIATSIGWPLRAFKTAFRKSSDDLATAGAGARVATIVGSGSATTTGTLWGAVAGAADPMTTGALPTTFGTAHGPGEVSADISGLPFRAESAANGDTTAPRDAESARRGSFPPTTLGRAAGVEAAVDGATPLSNSSIGNRR